MKHHRQLHNGGRRLAPRNPVHLLTASVLLSCSACGLIARAQPPITAIEFSDDGQSLVSCSQAGLAVHKWPNLEAKRLIATHAANNHALAFSPDGTRLAVAGGDPAEAGYVEIFSWPQLERLALLGEHSDSVLSSVWLDELTLATASLDRNILLWNTESSTILRRLSGHSRGVASVCIADAETLVSTGIDQNVRVWNVASGQQVRSLNNHTQRVHQLVTRPLSSRHPMVASISDDRSVRFWQPTIGRMVRFARLNAVPLDAVWLSDSSAIAVACDDGTVQIIDPDTAQLLHSVPAFASRAMSIAAHPSDGTLAVGGRHGQLKRLQW